jgi:hypothetical protein
MSALLTLRPPTWHDTTHGHVPHLGNMKKNQPERVFGLLEGQMNSALSTDARLRKMGNIVQLCKEYEMQGRSLSEVGVNWSTFAQSANLALWFREEIPDVRMHSGNNKHEGVPHHQPGGTATFACGELARYVKQKGDDFCGLGRWCPSLIYANPKHRTPIVSAYNVGRQTPKGESTIYQQQLRYIQNHGLLTTPTRLFTADFVAQLQVWQQQGYRLLIFMDMNEHALRGSVACCLTAMGLTEATHHHWGDKEPHTYIGGVEPIDGVWHTPDLKVLAVLQLSLHKGVGNHCTVLVDITMYSTIGRQEFKIVHPHAWRLNSTNHWARSRYNQHLEEQMSRHRMVERLTVCKKSITGYPTSNKDRNKMQRLGTQMEEMQRGSEHQFRQIYSTEMPFSKPVQNYHLRRRAYQGLLLVLDGTANNISNAF